MIASAEQIAAVEAMLRSFGVDLNNDSLAGTPERVARMYAQLLCPSMEPSMTVFPSEALDHRDQDQMIVVRGIRFNSMCEHHMLPFFGSAAVAYIPGSKGKIVGLSKLARAVDHFAKGLQVQERITVKTADFIMDRVEAQGVIVMLQARHLCMEVRGVHKPGSETFTQAIRGRIDKHELLSLLQQPKV